MDDLAALVRQVPGLHAIDKMLSVAHREDDRPCGCDECMSYGAEDAGADWVRIPVANRIVMRILDSGDDRLASLVKAFHDHEDASPDEAAGVQVGDAGLREALEQIATASAIPDGWEPYDSWGDYNARTDGHDGEIGVDQTNMGDVHGHGRAMGLWDAAKVARAALRDTKEPDPEAVYIVFDGPPGPESGRFIEAETKDGLSIGGIGSGPDPRTEGWWRLGPLYRAPQPDPASRDLREAALRAALRLYRLEHDDECGCEGCDAFDNATSEYPDDWAALAARSDWPIPVRAALARPVPPALTVERLGAALDNHAHAIGWDRMCTGEDCGAALIAALREAGKEPEH